MNPSVFHWPSQSLSICNIAVAECNNYASNVRVHMTLGSLIIRLYSSRPKLFFCVIGLGFLPLFLINQWNEIYPWWNWVRMVWNWRECSVLVNTWHFPPMEIFTHNEHRSCTCVCVWVCSCQHDKEMRGDRHNSCIMIVTSEPYLSNLWFIYASYLVLH